MSDGRIHPVHVSISPRDVEPPERCFGALKCDVTTGVANDTAESLRNSGMDADTGDTMDGPSPTICRPAISIHLTINRIALEPGTFPGLVVLRLPTEAGITAADLDIE